jgi:hypothetical protein
MLYRAEISFAVDYKEDHNRPALMSKTQYQNLDAPKHSTAGWAWLSTKLREQVAWLLIGPCALLVLHISCVIVAGRG